MLYQDRLTGLLHEVPDGPVQGFGYGENPDGIGEPQMVYDGLGNPLGFSFKRALGKLAAKAAPFAATLGPWGMVASRALPLVSRAMLAPHRPPMPPPLQFMPPQMEPEPVGSEIGEMPMAYPRPGTYPMSMRQPTPIVRQHAAPRWIPASPAHWSRPTPAQWGPAAAMRPPIPAGWRRPGVPYTGVQPRRLYMRCAVWRGPGGLVPINPGQPAVAPQPAAAPAPMGHRRVRRRHRR